MRSWDLENRAFRNVENKTKLSDTTYCQWCLFRKFKNAAVVVLLWRKFLSRFILIVFLLNIICVSVLLIGNSAINLWCYKDWILLERWFKFIIFSFKEIISILWIIDMRVEETLFYSVRIYQESCAWGANKIIHILKNKVQQPMNT